MENLLFAVDSPGYRDSYLVIEQRANDWSTSPKWPFYTTHLPGSRNTPEEREERREGPDDGEECSGTKSSEHDNGGIVVMHTYQLWLPA